MQTDPNLAEISKCYEQNIGYITPFVADELRGIADAYPRGWFAEAVKIAVLKNARNLRYVRAILERWKVQGFKAEKKQERSRLKEL